MEKIVYKTTDEYIAAQPKKIQEVLNKIRETIRQAAPMATEKIAYGMPTFFQGRNLVFFAAAKNHIGFYPTPGAIEAFADKLRNYKTSKGTVQLPVDKVPLDLIDAMTRYRVNEVTKGEN